MEGAPGKEEEFSIRRLRRTAGIAIAECDALRLPVGFEIIGQLAEVEVSFAYWENSGENEVVTIRGNGRLDITEAFLRRSSKLTFLTGCD